MSCFEQIVVAYKNASQNFVKTNEELFVNTLQEVYDAKDDLFFSRAGFTKLDFLEYGIEGLIKNGKHPRIAQLYEMFSEGLHPAVVSREWNHAESNNMSAHWFGFKPCDEHIDLEYEIQMNSDLCDEKLVGHLLRLRGPFGTQAFYVCKEGGHIPFAGVPPTLYTAILMHLCKKTCELLRASETSEYKNKKKTSDEQPPDIDGESDF
ncbi:hypothetical protein HY484_00950 [Candidatus Woesearchaeota archaeon]|nr:hypothetical protein [Candidatus Woesearchaeota archaeon]